MASLCRNVWLQSVKINRDYTQLLAKIFSSRADVINYVPQAETILKLQEISKRVKAGSFDSEVINTIIDNQISTEGMEPLSESEKSRMRSLYNRVQARRGDIPIASFWVQLRDCFDQPPVPAGQPQVAMRASIPESALQHALAAFYEKQGGRFDPTYDKRTPLVGKAGPPRKRDEPPQDSSSDDLLPATRKQVRDLFSMLGQVAKGQRDQERDHRGVGGDNHLDAKETPGSNAVPGARTMTRSSTQTKRLHLGRAAGKQEEYVLSQTMKTRESRLKNMPSVPLQIPCPPSEFGQSIR
jgi:hypothetical protein